MPSRVLTGSFCWVALVAAIFVFIGQGAGAQETASRKFALVIGNSAYQHANRLANPTPDAKAVGASFQRLGFEVTETEDLGYDDMRRAILQFGRNARGADMAVIYYAGHGIELGGENWLVPVDADLQTELEVDNAAINLKSLMRAVSDTQTLGLVILDACRSNPFQARAREGRGTGGLDRGMDVPQAADRGLAPLEPFDNGLAPVDPIGNVLVAFAAKDGTTAQDGEGQHSPFTSALLSHIEAKGLEVNFLFRNIRDDVLAATRNRQEPYVYGSISKDYIYLNPPGTAQVEGPPIGGDEIAWAFLKGSNDLDTLQKFVTTFPGSSHSADVQVRIAALLNPRPDWTLLANGPGGGPAATVQTIAMKAEASPEDMARKFTHDSAAVDLAWDVIKAAKDRKTVEHFVDAFPTSGRRAAVRAASPVSIVARATIPRSAANDRQQALVRPDVPWASTRGVDADERGNDLLDVFSRDYEVRQDRRARACDQTAADPDDAGRTPGVNGAAFDRMDGRAALSACRAAVAAFPDVPRYRFQLCRAFSKLGRTKEASAQCEAAVEAAEAASASAGAHYVTFENINNIQGLAPSAGGGPPVGRGGPPVVSTPQRLQNAAGQVGARQTRAAIGIAATIARGGPRAQGNEQILGRVKAAVANTRGGRADLATVNGPAAGTVGPRAEAQALRMASRRFGASARALREGAQIARIEGKPKIALGLANQAAASRMLARNAMATARAAVRMPMRAPMMRPPMIRVAVPRPGMIRIAPPKIMVPKIQIMIPHIMIKRP